MATPIVISNAAQLTLNWSGPQRTWRNVLGLIGNPTLPAINQATAEALFTAIRGNSATVAYMGLMNGNTILESISLRSLNTPNLPEFTSTGTPLAGGGTGDTLPLNTALVVTIRTTGAGKSFRGRVYLAGFDETQNDANGRILPNANTLSQAFLTGIDNSAQAQNMLIAVLSRPKAAKVIPAKNIAASPGFATQRTAFQTRTTKWNSQRRRTGKQ